MPSKLLPLHRSVRPVGSASASSASRLRALGLIGALAAVGACGGGGGGGPSARPATYQLLVADAEGMHDAAAAGIDAIVGGSSVPVAIVQVRTTGTVDVTSRATLTIADGGIAAVDAGAVVGLAVGSTRLVVAIDGATLAADVRVHTLGDVPIVDFWFDDSDDIAVFDGAPRQLGCEGRLASGDFAAVTSRLAWSCSNPGVASVTADGVLQAVADGSAFVVARDPATGRERSRRLHVALPRPSGSVLGTAGGRIEAGAAAAWLPPFAFGTNAIVTVEQVSPAALPALPSGEPPVTAVRLTTGPQSQLGRAAVVSVTVPGDAPIELAEVLLLNPLNSQWQHVAWVTKGVLGYLEWTTWFPGVFAVQPAPGFAASLAAQHAPTFAIGFQDIGPISFEYLLAHCDLYRNVVVGPDVLVGSTPTVASLAAHDAPNFYLALDETEADEFETGGGDWSNAQMGGMGRRELWQPTVYWSIRTEQRRASEFGSTEHFIVVQYWLLYAASGLPLEYPGSMLYPYYVYHQGDLEFCQVILDGSVDPPAPIAATASQHFYGEGRHIRDVAKDGDRVLFHVALQSHATMFERGFEGVGNRHGTTTGQLGFTAKVDADATSHDFVPDEAEQDLLRASDYVLVDLDADTPITNALRGWRGTFDRGIGVPPWWPALLSGAVGTVASRSPGPAALAMYAHGLDFHFAYDFATRNSILAWRLLGLTAADADVARRVRVGQRMFELQQQAAASWPGEPVQPRIDQACAPQPQHLVDYLRADPTYAPNEYFACDEWRLLSVQPEAPLDATVGTPLTLAVSWAGFSSATLGAIVPPLRVILLPAVDEGYPATYGGSYPIAGGQQYFQVTPNTPLIVQADAAATSVQLDLDWVYRENGVAMPVPPAASAAGGDPVPWRFHLFVRDAANTTLYHSNSLVVGPYVFERDGEPIDVAVRLGP